MLAGLAPAAPAAAIPVEPLMIRVQDATGAPGGQTAIVFRTYASRPIRRGRLNSGVAAAVPMPAGVSQLVGTTTPIASCDAPTLRWVSCSSTWIDVSERVRV